MKSIGIFVSQKCGHHNCFFLQIHNAVVFFYLHQRMTNFEFWFKFIEYLADDFWLGAIKDHHGNVQIILVLSLSGGGGGGGRGTIHWIMI